MVALPAFHNNGQDFQKKWERPSHRSRKLGEHGARQTQADLHPGTADANRQTQTTGSQRQKDCERSQREGQSVSTQDKSKKNIRLHQKSHGRWKRASEHLSDQRIRVLSPGQLSFRREPGLRAGYTGALLRPTY